MQVEALQLSARTKQSKQWTQKFHLAFSLLSHRFFLSFAYLGTQVLLRLHNGNPGADTRRLVFYMLSNFLICMTSLYRLPCKLHTTWSPKGTGETGCWSVNIRKLVLIKIAGCWSTSLPSTAFDMIYSDFESTKHEKTSKHQVATTQLQVVSVPVTQRLCWNLPESYRCMRIVYTYAYTNIL